MLSQLPWVERCLSARTGAEAIALCRRYEPHVALVDLFLGGESGPEVCERLRAEAPAPRADVRRGRHLPACRTRRGGGGFRLQGLCRARRSRGSSVMVGDGQEVFTGRPGGDAPTLTDREREILALIAEGATNREIAATLFLSPHTVKEHTSAVYRKLGARNRADAVQRAQRLGLQR